MKRRVVLHGPATLTLSLPSSWVKRHHIQKGDELNVCEEGNALKVMIDQARASIKKTSFNCADMNPRSIDTILATLHKAGYDEIDVQFDNHQTMKIIHDRVYSMLIGYEIVEQTDHSCIIRNISNNEQHDFDNFFRRTFLVTLAMAEQSLEEFSKKEYTQLDELLVLEQTNNRLCNYCQRLINKMDIADHSNYFYFIVLWLLEKICDELRDIILFVKHNNYRFTKDALHQYTQVHELLHDYYVLFFKYNNSLQNGFHTKIARIENDVHNALSSCQRNDMVVLVHLHNIIQRIHDSISSTVGINH